MELSVKYINNRFLPDKAVDILDQSCAAARMSGSDTVTESVVLQIMAEKTGIPVIASGTNSRYINLESSLSGFITGQPQAVTVIAKALKRWRAGLKDDGKPIATFLFCGPTGVGKTHSCKVMADLLFPGQNALVRIDCTEYSESNNISKLIGSPPGYVGYDEGGRLEREILSRNGCVVLFDEAEKAHSDLHNLLLQAMDDGFITTARGKKISFGNAVIAITTNAAAGVITSKSSPLGFEKHTADKNTAVYAALKNYFSAEFLGRINHTVVFNSLDNDSLKEICKKSIFRLKEKLAKQNILLDIDDKVISYICEKSGISQSGARNINNTVSAILEDRISDMILSGELKKGDTAIATVENNEISVKVYIQTK
ncbi:MAG: ATP-dependent Clp protease ATP-binding subunit [Oscillospiraceae bacterium]|nr:ATP-dependent Clp protease ATP-binding subunit [Oscillospiraceae bacterium]